MEIKIWIKKIWKDSVCSKIIASGLIIMITAIIGAIKSKFQFEGLFSLFYINIPLWVLLFGVIFYVITTWGLGRLRKPSFLEFVCIKKLYGFSWSWKWEYNEETKRYKISDLKPLCRSCGERMHLESVYSRDYVCPNGHKCSSEKIKWGLAMTTIQDNVYERFGNEAEKYFEKTGVLY